jgi:hypothetical protein
MVYILLNAVEGKASQVAQMLRGRAGVRMVDVLEGLPNVIMVLQARSRQQLAEFTNQALSSVESLTEDVQVLPVRNSSDTKPTSKELKGGEQKG